MRVTNLKHENSASNNIVLNSDGSVGGELATTLASKLPYSYGTATPSTTDSGFLWYDSNSTPAAPKFWNGSAFTRFPDGLSLIASESFSAVSSVSVDGCFTSTYRNYRVVFSITKSTTLTLTMRWRVSGSDNTSSVYDRAGTFNSDATTAGGLQSLNQSSMQIGIYDPGTMLVGSGDIIDPQLAQPTFYVGQHFESDAGTVAVGANYNFIHSNSTAFDGFSIIASTGTITGVVRVYGYKD